MTNDEVKMEDDSAPRSGVQVIARAAAVLRKIFRPSGRTDARGIGQVVETSAFYRAEDC